MRKYIDFKYGTLNDTIARRMVAMRVTRKPGVAGLIIAIMERVVPLIDNVWQSGTVGV